MVKPAASGASLPAFSRRLSILGLTTAGCLIAAGIARADNYCNTPNARFFFSDPPSVYHHGFTVRSGEKCTRRYRFGGTMVFKNLAYQVDARHGKVDIFPNGTAVYTSKPGYHGPDSFTLRLCGASNGRDGCADLQYSVTVE